jgi:hypothetical protein
MSSSPSVQRPNLIQLKPPLKVDPSVLTKAGTALKNAADAAAGQPMGPARAKSFADTVLPVLLADAGRVLGAEANALKPVLMMAVNGAGSTADTMGLKTGDDGSVKADPNYPPRAANAVWEKFGQALGFSQEDIAWVTETNRQIGAVKPPEGKYAPDLNGLSPDLQSLATRVSKSLIGQQIDPALTSREKAFKASLVLNNLMWHATNFQRASGDAGRGDPTNAKTNNVYNTYTDNLAFAFARGGLGAVIDMAISDSYNPGKPELGKTTFPLENFFGSDFSILQSKPRMDITGGQTGTASPQIMPRGRIFE